MLALAYGCIIIQGIPPFKATRLWRRTPTAKKDRYQYVFSPLPLYTDHGVAASYKVSKKTLLALTYAMEEVPNGLVYVAGDGMLASHAITQAVWSGFHVPDTWIPHIAMSISNVIRASETSRSQCDGAVFELGIRIRWNWLMLSAALVGAWMLLLVAVIVRTACGPVKSWKGSLLTLSLSKLEKDV